MPDPPPALGPGALSTVAVSAIVHPLVVGTVLLVCVFFGGLGSYYGDSGSAALFGTVALLVTGGAHLLVMSVLRRLDAPHPGEFPTVLSAAVLLASAQAFVALAMNVQILWFLPLTCLLLSLFGATGWGLARSRRVRRRVPVALAAILAAALLLTGGSWVSAEREDQEEREELMRGLAGFPFPVAVLDSPDWEPSNMGFVDGEVQEESLSIVYAPVDPSPELDGFTLKLRVESLASTAGAGWPRRYELCGSEGGPWACEEHGDAVIAVSSDDGETEFVEARLEIADGVAAYLMTSMPNDHQGAPTIAFPDIDMAELSEHVRLAEAGEVEEIIVAVTE